MTIGRRCGQVELKGFTLIEIVVALSVGSVVALAIFGLFRLGYTIQRRTSQVIGAGEAALALDVIARNLREASHDPESVQVWSTTSSQDPYDAVAVRSARNTGSGFALGEEGQPSWDGWIGFIYDRAQMAVREVRFPSSGEVPSQPWEGGRVVARQVRAFSVDRDEDRLRITVLFDAKGKTLTLRTVIWPRNR